MEKYTVKRRDILKGTLGLSVASSELSTSLPVSDESNTRIVYIAGARGLVYAMDAEDGTELWTFDAPDDTDEDEDSSARMDSSPTVADGTLYFGSGSSGSFHPQSTVYAVDADTGTEIWRFETPEGPVTAAPTVVDGTVYVGSIDNRLYAVEADTGTKLWEYETDSWVVAAPAVVDDRVFVSSWDEHLHAVDTESGDRVWRSQTGNRINAAPTPHGDAVYVGSTDGAVYAFDAETGQQRWTFETGGLISSSPTIVSDCLYIGSTDDKIYALNVDDGTEEWHLTADGSVTSSPTVYDDIVYIGAESGTIFAIERTTGDVVWEGPTNLELDYNYSTSTATAVEDKLFLSHGAGLMAVDRESGQAVWISDRLTVFGVGSAPTIVEDPVDGESIGSRVRLGTLGHTDTFVEQVAGSTAPDIVGNGQPATDTTGDGTLNDINGDGEFDITDVQLLFENRDSKLIQNNPELFDFSDSSHVGINDVQALFEAL